ncbi:hypothetical protein OG471_00585 [Streptomyces sp. NBC_01336]|uniref:hypothetical protein n=1 Tax=Streptomyces sp. NBC_01336 TaxID=2903829 RepID=UPI002E146AA2|nr:hypothetical protein OG471_00585 [Streptomyces sp. NBC_01336]
MHALSSAVAHDLDPYVIKLLLMIVVAALSTIVALAAVIVSRFTSAGVARSLLHACVAFTGCATLLLAAISSFTSF